MVLPTFLIIGAQKAGTTWLASRVAMHPDVYMAPREIHFFDKQANFERGLAWYERHFRAGIGRHAIGEKTPDYLWANGRGAEGHRPEVHESIHAVLPDARLLVVLRDPVARAVSAAGHLIRSGRVTPRTTVDDLLTGGAAEIGSAHGLLEKGRYLAQLTAYEALFGKEQLKVFVLESDFGCRAKDSLREVWTHIGVCDPGVLEGRKVRRNENKRTRVGLSVDYYIPLARKIRLGRMIDALLPRQSFKARMETLERLSSFYEDEVTALEQYLERPLDVWRG